MSEVLTMMRYERRGEPILPRRAFLLRIVRSALVAGAIIGVGLTIGILGYHYFVGLPWLDAFLNAAMILSGMGPIDAPTRPAGKWFAGCYALFSGVAFITIAGILFTPIAHRLLHWFHLEETKREG
jgi:hypothetical protein